MLNSLMNKVEGTKLIYQEMESLAIFGGGSDIIVAQFFNPIC